MAYHVWIYQADLWCEDCIERIKAEARQPAHVDESDESTYDSDEWPKGPYSDGGGESDCPQNCAGCHRFLGNPLTSEGVEYVLEALESEASDLEAANRIMPAKGTAEDSPDFAYWHGSPHKAIVLEWAEDLDFYGLTEDQEQRLEAARSKLNP